MALTDYSIAVLIPCYNEELTIAEVVAAFRQQLPQAKVYVYDNHSTDNTAAIAAAGGAIIGHEPGRGKGNVVRRMFADIDSDIYIIMDGDATYPVENAPMLVQALVERRLDMVVATRMGEAGAFTLSRSAGNGVLNGMVRLLFGRGITDVCSGYRVFSRRFVKSFAGVSRGFDIEAELSIHAFDLRLPFAEIPVPYKQRPSGSSSKLRTVPDGLRIMGRILLMAQAARPLRCFALVGAVLFAALLMLGHPSAALMAAALCAGGGAMLQKGACRRRETKRQTCLQLAGLGRSP